MSVSGENIATTIYCVTVVETSKTGIFVYMVIVQYSESKYSSIFGFIALIVKKLMTSKKIYKKLLLSWSTNDNAVHQSSHNCDGFVDGPYADGTIIRCLVGQFGR